MTDVRRQLEAYKHEIFQLDAETPDVAGGMYRSSCSPATFDALEAVLNYCDGLPEPFRSSVRGLVSHALPDVPEGER